MTCNADCKCRKGVVAFVVVPGIMGTRLKNRKTKESAWDPAAGFGFSGPSSQTVAVQDYLDTELDAAQPDNNDNWFESLRKRYSRVNLRGAKAAIKVADAPNIAMTKLAGVPRIWDVLWSNGLGRKKLLIDGNTKKRGKAVTTRDDKLLKIDEGTARYFRTYTSVSNSQVALKKQRGWGEVHWDSYGPFLRYLEKQEVQLKKEYPGLQFPVFAVGYNWMDSNEKSGERLITRLADFKKQLLDEDKKSDNPGLTENHIKFVVISHSMGGFVSRSAFKLGGLEPEIEAVIHGAMPTHGSPSTYRQLRAGAEGGKKLFLGKNAADMTAILGFCQGGLELLPNQLYVDRNNNPEWLFVNPDPERPDSAKQSLLPKYGDAVFDFYRRFDVWYRLVQPYLLAPEGVRSQNELGKYKKAFSKRIAAVQNFHTKLAAQFHATTTLLYSHNADTPAIDYCEWQRQGESGEDLSQVPPDDWRQVSNQNHNYVISQGKVGVWSSAVSRHYSDEVNEWAKQARYSTSPYPPPAPKRPAEVKFRINKGTAPGDGTVHKGAGNYPGGAGPIPKVITIGLDASEEHQGFYNCDSVREQVITQLKAWLPDIYNNIPDI